MQNASCEMRTVILLACMARRLWAHQLLAYLLDTPRPPQGRDADLGTPQIGPDVGRITNLTVSLVVLWPTHRSARLWTRLPYEVIQQRVKVGKREKFGFVEAVAARLNWARLRSQRRARDCGLGGSGRICVCNCVAMAMASHNKRVDHVTDTLATVAQMRVGRSTGEGGERSRSRRERCCLLCHCQWVVSASVRTRLDGRTRTEHPLPRYSRS